MPVVEIEKKVRGSELREIMHRHVDDVCDNYKEDGLAGFHITGWGFDSSFSNGYRIHENSPFGITLLPAVISEILRRNTATAAAEDVMHEVL